MHLSRTLQCEVELSGEHCIVATGGRFTSLSVIWGNKEGIITGAGDSRVDLSLLTIHFSLRLTLLTLNITGYVMDNNRW